MDNNAETYVTQQDLELFKLENSSVTKVDNKVTNKVDVNSNDIKLLKNTNLDLTKRLVEMNGVVQMLKATVLTQTTEFNDLKRDFYKFFEEQELNNDEQEGTQEGTQKGTQEHTELDNNEEGELVQLKVSEKK